MNKTMLALLLCLSTVFGKAQSVASDKGADMLRDFYKAYITASSQDAEPALIERKLTALRKKYCTPACLIQYKKLLKQTDADPIVKAQDMDVQVLHTLQIQKDQRKPNRYLVTYSDPADRHETTTIYVTLLQQQGVFKIAELK